MVGLVLGVRLQGVQARWALLGGVAAACRRAGAPLRAFGLGRGELRLVLASERAVWGAVSAARRRARVWDEQLLGTLPLTEGARWAHDVEEGPPLARVWTSHRDQLGFRFARLVPTVAPRTGHRIHAALGGRALPSRSRLAGEFSGAQIRQSARQVAGELRFGPRSRALCATLAVDLGLPTTEAACIAGLSPRRVRQLRARPEHRLGALRATLVDPRLRVDLHTPGVGSRPRVDKGGSSEAHARLRHR